MVDRISAQSTIYLYLLLDKLYNLYLLLNHHRSLSGVIRIMRDSARSGHLESVPVNFCSLFL